VSRLRRLRREMTMPLNVAFEWREKMTSSPAKKLLILLASAALATGSIAPAFAQSSDAGAAGGDSANAAAPAAQPAKPTKAERKAARKQARAKKNAELKKLEDAGYNPAQNDPNYPTNLQNAQKKAGIGQAASQ
jgi:hypothetical protein